MDSEGALDGLRVLDLTEGAVQYTGKLLAGLGADVVLVEPPAGAVARRLPPFAGDVPDENRSLPFWYWNTGKRSLTLDLTTADGRAILHRLVPRFDVLIHTFAPAAAAALGLARETLAALHPRLVQCTVRPYGTWGPYADYAASDLTVTAMSGVMFLLGWPDRAPTTPAGDPAAVCGAIHAAQAILAAVLGRDRTGLGQWIEVSEQEAMSIAQETAMQFWDLRHELRGRSGGSRTIPGVGIYACADGHIYAMGIRRGAGSGGDELLAWMIEEGKAGDLAEEPWYSWLQNLDLRQLLTQETDAARLAELQAKLAHVDELYAAFFLTKNKQELYREGQRRRLMVGPINTAADLYANEHLQERGWWQTVEHPDLDRSITYPGAPFHHSVTPWQTRRPPRLGEHTLAILRDDLGLEQHEAAQLLGSGAI